MFSVISETADPALRPRSARCTRSRGRRSLGLASGSSHQRRRTTSGLPFTNNGDLLQKASTGQEYQFAYDLSSNLRNVQITGSGASTVDYLIDGLNRRIGKEASTGGPYVQDGLLYDEQGRVVAELDGSNNVLSTFVYGLKPNVPDYMVRGGVAYRIVSDWRGDVRLVLNTTLTGPAAVVQQIDYDEWGNVINLVDPGCTLGGAALCFQPFGFAGGVWDVTTGVVRFGARDYDPLQRRWTQKDPIGFDGGDTNIYAYVGDDPINWHDPTGLAGCFDDKDKCKNQVAPGPTQQPGQSKHDCIQACNDYSQDQLSACKSCAFPNGGGTSQSGAQDTACVTQVGTNATACIKSCK